MRLIHFIHVKSRHENALPLIITHGWPGSVIEMLDVIGPLTDPTAYGGTEADAFHVVIPSMPGFGFSDQPTELGWSGNRIARAWAELMTRLGYTRYVAQGGDQGATVTDAMARQAPAGLVGIHLNFLSAFPTAVGAALFGDTFAMGLVKRAVVGVIASRAEKEPEALAGIERTFRAGYIAEMNTKPQTIGYGSMDPLAMAAWILDHDPDSYAKISKAFLDGQPTGGLTRDHVLDNITLYWLTNTSTSAARLYWENFQNIVAALASGQKAPDIKVSTGFTVFPQELFKAPKSWAEKVYPNLTYFNEAPKGGHFAAWEEPQVFSEELVRPSVGCVPPPDVAARRTASDRRPSSTGRALLHLLQDPAVPIGIGEPRERGVIAPGRVAAGHLPRRRQVVKHAAQVVEHVADRDATPDQLEPGGVDIRDHELQSADRTGNGGGDAGPENDGRCRTGRRELDHPEVRARGVVEVLPEPRLQVERLRTVDIGDRDHDDLEPHVHPRISCRRPDAR